MASLSEFSPEDLPSNYLGVYAAMTVLKGQAPGFFPREDEWIRLMDAEFSKLIEECDPITQMQAQDLHKAEVEGKWYKKYTLLKTNKTNQPVLLPCDPCSERNPPPKVPDWYNFDKTLGSYKSILGEAKELQ